MHQQDNCIFCQIIQGKLPCYKIHEDDSTFTFLDLFPSSDGHLLIIPKHHYDDIFEAPAEIIAKIAANSVVLAKVMKQQLHCDGISVHQMNRAAAGQTVFHYHMHLIPHLEGVSTGIHSKTKGEPDKLQQLATTLKAAMNKDK